MKIGVLLALPLVAFFVIKKKDLSVSWALVPPSFFAAGQLLIGLLIGAYDGLEGPGTGTFLMLCYVSFWGCRPCPPQAPPGW